jgi:hypothetical protein
MELHETSSCVQGIEKVDWYIWAWFLLKYEGIIPTSGSVKL